MRISLYKIIMFLFQIVIIILLTILCIQLNAFDFLTEINCLKTFKMLFNNSYIVNILCSIVSVLILYLIQVNYSKHKIKKDFRCNEIISDLYDGIERTTELLRLTKDLENNCEEPNNQEVKYQNNHATKRKIEALSYYNFYIDHISDFNLCNLSLTYENNKILIDSVQSVFFINLNFKLLSIVNNIKNRKPNLVNGFAEITELYTKYQTTNNEAEMIKCGEKVKSYLVDIRFMATYIIKLLDYLKYDPFPSKLYIETFKKRYPTNNDLMNYLCLPFNEQKKIEKEITREVQKSLCIHKIGTYFRKDNTDLPL